MRRGAHGRGLDSTASGTLGPDRLDEEVPMWLATSQPDRTRLTGRRGAPLAGYPTHRSCPPPWRSADPPRRMTPRRVAGHHCAATVMHRSHQNRLHASLQRPTARRRRGLPRDRGGRWSSFCWRWFSRPTATTVAVSARPRTRSHHRPLAQAPASVTASGSAAQRASAAGPLRPRD